MSFRLALFFTLLAPVIGFSQILDGSKLKEVPIEAIVPLIQPGSVLILGENHGSLEMASQHVEILRVLRSGGLKVSVGMEFFPYTNQTDVDLWRAGSLTEEEFLKRIGWGKGFSFDAYRQQVQFPSKDSYLLALNSPRSLTAKVAKSGLASLTDEEQNLLPPKFSLGNKEYFKRFKEAIGHDPGEENLANYFAAQSIWDDTMAWMAKDFLQNHPEQVLVIIVGEFHSQYGGGLPDRLGKRGVSKVKTLSQINTFALTAMEIIEAVTPFGQYGKRADWLWLSNFDPSH